VNQTLIKRVAPMLARFPQDTLVLTGGVARNGAFVTLLRRTTQAEILLPAHPQHNGAIGCAVIAANG
jgi:activator of 2-hydroxyglutaryl-CoA dehydratase